MYLGSAAVDRWRPLAEEMGAYWGVDPARVEAVIDVESSGNPDAYNPNDPGGARGLMQIVASTAQAYGVTDLNSLFNPTVNVSVGTELLSDLEKSYGDDFRRVYSAYNSGNPDRWLTSAAVSHNVDRAMAALNEYAGASAGPYNDFGTPEGGFIVEEAAAPSWAILAAGIGLLFATSRRKRGRR